jgi:hypothetical protein
MIMARLWRAQGKRDEARDLLAPVYNWFTEGFGTLDLSVTRPAGVMSRLFLVGRVLGLKQVPATDPKGGPRRLSGLLIYAALTDWPRRGTDEPGRRAWASCKYAQFVTLKT